METELNGKTIILKLGEVEENEHAKWRNGKVKVDDRVFDVGGGWLYDNGTFDPYDGSEMGWLGDLMDYCGLNHGNSDQRNKTMELIQRLSEQCACANV